MQILKDGLICRGAFRRYLSMLGTGWLIRALLSQTWEPLWKYTRGAAAGWQLDPTQQSSFPGTEEPQ